MPNVKEKLTDGTILHQIRMERLSADMRRRVTSELVALRKDVLAQIAGTDAPGRLKQLKSLLKDIDSVVRARYGGISEQQFDTLTSIAAMENRATRSIVNTAVGVGVMDRALSEKWINAVTREVTIFGAPAVDWWKRQSDTARFEFQREMRAGILQAETIQQLTNRVGRVVVGLKRDAQALARTSALSVANEARHQTYLDHQDVIKGEQAVATLDNRTTQICMTRDGMAWHIEDRSPFPGTDQPWPGPPPWHWNCRSTLVAVLKSFEELTGPNGDKRLAKLLDNAPKSTRASMDGQVPDTLNYEDWLKTKSDKFQERVLGPTKHKLWKDGKISFKDMVDQTGNPLTIEEIKEIYA